MSIAQASALYLTLFVFGAVGYVAYDHTTTPVKACIAAGHAALFQGQRMPLEQLRKSMQNVDSWCRGGGIVNQ